MMGGGSAKRWTWAQDSMEITLNTATRPTLKMKNKRVTGKISESKELHQHLPKIHKEE